MNKYYTKPKRMSKKDRDGLIMESITCLSNSHSSNTRVIKRNLWKARSRICLVLKALKARELEARPDDPYRG